MSFHNVRLPVDVERGAQGGPGFKTTVIELSSGFEKRNIDWERSRGKWDVGYGFDDKEDLVAPLTAFFYARRGKAYGFRFKDWSDFEIARQTIGTGDAVTVAYQVFKRYSSGGYDFDRKITRLVTGSVSVWVANVLQTEITHYTVDVDTGIITFVTAPGVKATGTLATTGQPLNGETVTLNGKVYTFQTVLTNSNGNVLIGATTEDTYDNLIAAVNLAAGAGTLYAAATTLHPTISASEGTGTDVLFTAKEAGAAGNALTTTEAATNASFANATLTGGVTALVEVECEFDVPVRFDTDDFKITMEIYNVGSIPQLPLVELKE